MKSHTFQGFVKSLLGEHIVKKENYQ